MLPTVATPTAAPPIRQRAIHVRVGQAGGRESTSLCDGIRLGFRTGYGVRLGLGIGIRPPPFSISITNNNSSRRLSGERRNTAAITKYLCPSRTNDRSCIPTQQQQPYSRVVLPRRVLVPEKETQRSPDNQLICPQRTNDVPTEQQRAYSRVVLPRRVFVPETAVPVSGVEGTPPDLQKTRVLFHHTHDPETFQIFHGLFRRCLKGLIPGNGFPVCPHEPSDVSCVACAEPSKSVALVSWKQKKASP